MRALLIPVKAIAQAKRRLTGHFSASARAALAQALWQDFFDVVALTGIAQIFVVSIEPRVLDRARALGWHAIHESEQVSESASVDFASGLCEERGADSLLRLPVDLPSIEPRDIQSLLEQTTHAPSVTIVPSRDGQGTNALLRTPPALFPSHFGPGSFAKHLAEAARVRAQVKVLRNPRIEADIDDPGDLALLDAAAVRGQRTRAWLEEQAAVLKDLRRAQQMSA